MAIVTNNDITRGTRGKVGEVVFKVYGNKTILSKKPDMSNVSFTKKQKNVHSEMANATIFGKKVIADPARKKACMKLMKVPASRAFHASIKEYFEALKQKRKPRF